MTVEEFQTRKAELLLTYGSTAQDAGRKRAQALARLYAESRFTERELAEIEHMAQSRIHQWLVFGRFLQFLITTGNHEYPEGERAFRTAWLATDTSRVESARFQTIVEQMQATPDKPDTTQPSTRALTKAIIAHCADRKWHPVTAIAEAVGSDIPTVRRILDRMVTHGSFHTFAEKRPSAKGLFSYRLVKGGTKKIDVVVFESEIEETLAEMKKVVFGHPLDFSQNVMRILLDTFIKTVERLAR